MHRVTVTVGSSVNGERQRFTMHPALIHALNDRESRISEGAQKYDLCPYCKIWQRSFQRHHLINNDTACETTRPRVRESQKHTSPKKEKKTKQHTEESDGITAAYHCQWAAEWDAGTHTHQRKLKQYTEHTLSHCNVGHLAQWCVCTVKSAWLVPACMQNRVAARYRDRNEDDGQIA